MRLFRQTGPPLTDITEFQIPAGKVYLSPIIDCFDGLDFFANRTSGSVVEACVSLERLSL